ncbi:11791_t:CDS:2, partial [Ambispora gerdemannii]
VNGRAEWEKPFAKESARCGDVNNGTILLCRRNANPVFQINGDLYGIWDWASDDLPTKDAGHPIIEPRMINRYTQTIPFISGIKQENHQCFHLLPNGNNDDDNDGDDNNSDNIVRT